LSTENHVFYLNY